MLLKMSFSGGILILLIIILRSLAINKLSKKVFVLLWDIVLFRLLIPVDLPFRYGIASPVVKMAGNGIGTVATVGSHSSQGKAGEFIPDLEQTGNIIGIDWTVVVWLAGVITLLAIFGVQYLRERQRLQQALPISKEAEMDLRSLADIPDRIKLLVSDRISTPLTFGIFLPKIILSKVLKTTDAMQLKYVLTHEMIHVKRADNLWKNMMLLVVCIHWFNPLVWVMYVLFNRDIELSCDEKVISLFGENTKKEYAMALVYLAEKQCRPSLFSNGFGKNAIQERIVAIMNFKKATVLSIGCAVLLVGAAVTVFAQNDLSAGTVGDSVNQSVSMGNNTGTSYTTVGYNEDEIYQRLNELEGIINAKFDELCSGNGNADKLDEEIYTATQEQLELETMLANLQNQAYYDKTYGTYGLEYQLPANELYYDGKPVKYFVDNQSVSASGFSGNLWENPNGEISVEAVRNGSGEISGLKEMSAKDIKAFNATHASSMNGNDKAKDLQITVIKEPDP